jgi:nucleoid DNA-binding protein
MILQTKYDIINLIFDGFTNTLKNGGRIDLRGLGVFSVRDYKPYTGRNPKTGENVDVKPGTFHFNPINKVHGSKNTGKEHLVLLSIFTPAMKETDRHFVDEK